ncbi:MAG TPA: glutathione S-transferase N-terminal domain-containing protein [Caulobacteraceae bacterium]|jgi:glutathione S-transferase
MKPELYYSPGACSLAPHIALREAGAEFDLRPVKFAENQQRSPQHLELNPLGRVPVLTTADGTLTENPAILGWIARRWPDAKLAPLDDPWALAQVESFNSFVASSVHVAFSHLFRPGRWVDPEPARKATAAKAPETLRNLFDIVEAKLAAGPFVHGKRFTTSDPYLLVMSRWFLRAALADVSRYRRVRAHATLIQERPATLEALAAEGLTAI